MMLFNIIKESSYILFSQIYDLLTLKLSNIFKILLSSLIFIIVWFELLINRNNRFFNDYERWGYNSLFNLKLLNYFFNS